MPKIRQWYCRLGDWCYRIEEKRVTQGGEGEVVAIQREMKS